MKVENLNAHEIIHQMSTAQADQAAASSAKPADPDEADGGDDPCRRPKCVAMAAELDEARNRFKQTVQKLTVKLEKAERSAHAETEQAGALANANQQLTTEVQEAKEKLRFEEDRLEDANRRINEPTIAPMQSSSKCRMRLNN